MNDFEDIPDDVAEVFGWDKLGDAEPSSEPAEGEVSEAEGEKEPEPETPTEEPASPPAKEAAQPEGEKEVGEPDEVALLKERLRVLQGKMEEKEAPKTEAKTEEPKAEDVPAYNFAIPDQIVNMMASEEADERRAAIGHLVSGVARSIHKTLRTEFEQKLQTQVGAVVPSVQNMVQAQSKAKSIRDDFYGKYPELNREEFFDIVGSVSTEYMKSNNVNGWNAQTRDAIANMVFERLGMKKAKPAAPKKTGFTPTTNRPPTQEKPSEQDDIMKTLF